MLLSVNDLSVEFTTRQGKVRAVDGVSFALESGKTLCLVGESGSGKSVSATSILRLLEKNGEIVSGEILFNDGKAQVDLTSCKEEELRKIRGNKISMIFQEPMTALNPVLTIARQIAEPFIIHRGMHKKQAQKEGGIMLEKVRLQGVERVLKSYSHQLSGGQRQRVMIAMALACQPKILIADEPTTALDVTVQAQILTLMRTLQKEQNASILFITHDLGVVREMADDVAVMYAGRIVELSPTPSVFENSPYSHPYTEGLLSSMPSQKTRGKELRTIIGSVPPLNALPRGCKFSTRCNYCTQKCLESEPLLYNTPTGQKIRCYYPEKEIRRSEKHKSITIRPLG